MIVLKIRQTTSDGRTKLWRLSQHKTRLTFGSSRKADLFSIDNRVDAFHAVFELKNDQWHCITFGIKDVPATRIVDAKTCLKMPNSQLNFEVQYKESYILEHLEKINVDGAEQKNLVLVTRNNQVISTAISPIGQKFTFFHNDIYEQIAINPTEQWQETERDGFIIKSRKVSVEQNDKLSKVNSSELWDKDTRKYMGVVIGLSLLVAAASFFAPGHGSESVTATPRTMSSNFIVKTPAAAKLKKIEAVAAAKPQPSSAGGSESKASALIKASVGMRISQLLGKVSATEARTNNVILTTRGVKASEASSGRALAAVGKVEASGHNWNGESVGQGGGIGTAGSGGGKGTRGLGGGLGQGKTGSGGVGLIEEESEIIGGLDREVIAQYIKTQLGQILYCYERQLSASPDLFGKIAVRFTIAGTGSVETQSINDTTLKSSSVENCILNKVSKWKFPEPKGGTKVLVTYPFLFKSTN